MMKRLLSVLLLVVFVQQPIFASTIIWKSKVIERPDGAVIYNKIDKTGVFERPSWGRSDAEILFTLSKGGYESGYSNLYLLDVKTSTVEAVTNERNRRLESSTGHIWTGDGYYFTERRNDLDLLRKVTISHDNMAETYKIEDRLPLKRWVDIGNPSQSPDGEWLLYDSASEVKREDGSKVRQIYKMNQLTGEIIQLTTGDSDKRRPRWSPEGSLILYEQYDRQFREWSIYTVTYLGKHHRRLTSGMGDETYGSFSPDGQWVVYTASQDISGEDLERNRLFIQSIYGDTIYPLTNARFYDTMPSWSPEGDRILFQTSPKEPVYGVAVWIAIIELPENIEDLLLEDK